MHRHELAEHQWNLIKDLFPEKTSKTGRPRRPAREMLNGILTVLRTGSPWRDLPERYGPWQTVFHWFNLWQKSGTFDRAIEALQIRLDKNGEIDWDLWCIDGSSVRASRAAAGAGKRGAPKSPQTTLWAARAADSAASSTWLLTAEACPSLSMSLPVRSTSRRSLKRR